MAFPVRYPTPPTPTMPTTPNAAWQGAMTQAPSVAPSAPMAPPASARGNGVGSKLLEMLPVLLGGMSSRGGTAFQRGMERARQEKFQGQQLQEQSSTRQQQLAIQQAELVARQQAAEQARQAKEMEAWQGVRQFLADPLISTPEDYDARVREAIAAWQAIGKDPAPIASLAKTLRDPARFSAAAVKADRALADGVVEKFSKINGDIAKAIADSGDGRGPQVTATKPDGQTVTRSLADWIQSGSQFATSEGGAVYTPKAKADVAEDYSKSGLDVQMAAALRRGDTVEVNRLEDAKRRIGQADDRPSAGTDPEIAELRKELLRTQVERAKNVSTGGRPITSMDAGRMAELQTSLDDVSILRATVLPKDTKTGKPVDFKATGTSARVGAALPNWVTEYTGWGTDAKQRQAVIDRVKQVIGKALEGGVLRKEDEYKYVKILPTIGDTSAVVATKLDGLETAIKLRKERSLEALDDAGYDTSRFTQRSVGGTDKVGRFEIVGVK